MSEFKYQKKDGQVTMVVDGRIFVRWNERWVPASEAIETLPSKVELNKETLFLGTGKTSQLEATVTPGTTTTKTVIWSSSNEAIATVSNAGLVTAVAAGTATITCACSSDPSVKDTCGVTVEILPTKVELNKDTVSLAASETEQLTATVTPATATTKTVTWSSSDDAIATVSAAGLVTAVADGTATITCACTSDSSVKAECEVTVA